MGVSPGDPWGRIRGDAHDDSPDGYGDGEAEIDGGQYDETPVAAIGQVGVGANEFLELLPPR